MKATLRALPFLAVVAFALIGCRAPVPIQNVNEARYGGATYAESQSLSLTDYEKAIVRAGSQRNWVFERVGPGHLVGTNLVRGKHTAVVDVMFDTETFSIDYRDSNNLDWNPVAREIHPNYNAWVELLAADIKAEIQRLRAS